MTETRASEMREKQVIRRESRDADVRRRVRRLDSVEFMILKKQTAGEGRKSNGNARSPGEKGVTMAESYARFLEDYQQYVRQQQGNGSGIRNGGTPARPSRTRPRLIQI